jgi:L-aminopeptidase/D-esterase-like protein
LPEGSVGGGTGMNVYAYKGGTGTASRVVDVGGSEYTVAVLMQANFGERRELTVAGRHLGAVLAEEDNPFEAHFRMPAGAGSCITVVATDAPLLPAQCEALARRVALGLARTGTSGGHFSGDIFLAFSTANAGALDSEPGARGLSSLSFVPWGAMDPLYESVVQGTEEAVLNALVAGREMTGREGRRSPGFPVERLEKLLKD